MNRVQMNIDTCHAIPYHTIPYSFIARVWQTANLQRRLSWTNIKYYENVDSANAKHIKKTWDNPFGSTSPKYFGPKSMPVFPANAVIYHNQHRHQPSFYRTRREGGREGKGKGRERGDGRKAKGRTGVGRGNRGRVLLPNFLGSGFLVSFMTAKSFWYDLFSEVGVSCAILASRSAVSVEKSARRYSRSEIGVFRCYVVVRVAEVAASSRRCFPQCSVAHEPARWRRNFFGQVVEPFRTRAFHFHVVRPGVFGVRQSGHCVHNVMQMSMITSILSLRNNFFHNINLLWSTKQDKGKELQNYRNSFTLLRSQHEKLWPKQLFQVTAIFRLSDSHKTQFSQPYVSTGKQYALTKCLYTSFSPFLRSQHNNWQSIKCDIPLRFANMCV